MEAALAPAPAQAPDKAVMVASAAPGAPLSQIAAGAAGRPASTAATAPAPATPPRADAPPARKAAEPGPPAAPTLTGNMPVRIASVPETSRLVARLQLAAAENTRFRTHGNRAARPVPRYRRVAAPARQRIGQAGRLSGARRLFLAAAESGNAAAATAMGKTYDPAFVGTLDAMA